MNALTNWIQHFQQRKKGKTMDRTKYINDTIEPTYYPTPNPNAMKFVFNVMLSYEGKNTYRSIEECSENPLCLGLLQLKDTVQEERLIENVHLFQNTLTITKKTKQSWEEIIPLIESYLLEEIPYHNPNFITLDPEILRRKNLSKELLEIEEILDKTIRGGLQSDGGDVKCIDFKNDVLLIKYMGACGSCPSSSTGTLEAIKHILSEKLNRPIDVYIAPSSTPE